MKQNDLKWAEAFDNGYRFEKAYLLLNNAPPNKFRYVLDERYIDLENYDFSILEKNYPNAIITKNAILTEATTSCVEEEPVPYTEMFIDGHYDNCSCIIYDGTVFYSIEPDQIFILYNDEDPKKLFEDIMNLLVIKEPEVKESEVQLVARNSEDYYTVTSRIEKMSIDIDKHYNSDFLPVYNDIVKFLEERKSGLVILRGTKGTGKTSLLRHLIGSHVANYIIITNAIAEHLASPEFMSFMLDHKDAVFILEDCEQILMKRELNYGAFSGAISNILNMSDGLMSDIFNIKFICTFNADIDKIDEALLRKGRCFANYEFKELCTEKTKVLLNEQGIKLDSYKPMTLADIYHYEDRDCKEPAAKKIGF